MVNGNGVNFQIGKESVYGTAVSPTNKLEISSESLKYTANKTEEGLLTGAIGGSMVETMSKKCEGSFSTLAKPTSVGYILKGVLGKEVVSEQAPETLKFTHSFTPVGNKEGELLPSYTFTIDRGLKQAFTYSGMVIDSVSFNAAAEDRLKLDVNVLGREESTGTVSSELSITLERSFKFCGAKIIIDETPVADITSIGFEYKNNCDQMVTTDTCPYFSEPVPGKRECTSTLEAIYTNDIENMRNNKFKNDTVIKLVINFKDSLQNELIVTIPHAQISTMDNPTATGAETLKQSLTIQAIDAGGDFVKVELKNDKQEEY